MHKLNIFFIEWFYKIMWKKDKIGKGKLWFQVFGTDHSHDSDIIIWYIILLS